MKRMNIVTIFTALAIAAPALAEGHGRAPFGVPPRTRPAAGLCRVWIDGLPAARQPGPMDCATAQARVPRNGRIIYGDRVDQRDPRINQRDPRIRQTNGRVVTINGRRCVQTPDRFGILRTVCADGDHDRDDRIVARAERRDDRRFDHRNADWKKHKNKHKHDKDHDRDHDRDRDRDRHNEFDRRGRH